jgi:hypothetical protein
MRVLKGTVGPALLRCRRSSERRGVLRKPPSAGRKAGGRLKAWPHILLLALLAAAPAAAPAAPPDPQYVQAVEFPYYLYPRNSWERELVWLKTIGVRTVEFSIPWNWHQLPTGEFDFNGRTSPRRDLIGFIRILRRLELQGWVRPLPPVAGWSNNGWPAGTPDGRARRAWLKELVDLLAPQTKTHGGPIVFVEGRELAIEAAAPPTPVAVISVSDRSALARSREAVNSGHGALLWRDVEESLYPAGWEPPGTWLLHTGAVDLSGKETASTTALRRESALLQSWAPFLPGMRTVVFPRPPTGMLPAGVTAVELSSHPVSAVSIINRGESPFASDLRVLDPATKRPLILPKVSVPAGDSLWLPLNVSLGSDGLCRECSNFSAAERVVYATAELLTVEFENGILAMEFSAPEPAEVILQLEREPVGPLLAAGKPTKFDWDDKTLRARLPIPAGSGPGHRVRIGLAIEEPETSAFFGENARRLIIGQKNLISTVYSSAEVAARSRLRVPEGFTATPAPKSPNEIDYTVHVPAEAVHGDFASLALEADGVPLGRARLQLLRPASIRLTQALALHFGARAQLAPDPPIAPVDARGGSNLELVIRNNSPQIQTYRLEATGDDLEFSPARTEISVGAMAERSVLLRVFGKEGATGLRDWHVRVSGGAEETLPFRAVLVPRAGVVAWSADLDGDGSPEWVLESQKARAIFSSCDGGRWMEFTWKDTGTNFLPPEGALSQTGAVQVLADGDMLTFSGNGWTRSVSLNGARLKVEQSTSLPDLLAPQTVQNLSLSAERQSDSAVVYEIQQSTER